MARNHCTDCGKYGHNSVRCNESKIIGQVFGEWKVSEVGYSPESSRRKPSFVCKCTKCGEERIILKEKLTGGRFPKSTCKV